MYFAGFLRVQIHSCKLTFRKPCSPLHQGVENRADTELFLRAIPFILLANMKAPVKALKILSNTSTEIIILMWKIIKGIIFALFVLEKNKFAKM